MIGRLRESLVGVSPAYFSSATRRQSRSCQFVVVRGQLFGMDRLKRIEKSSTDRQAADGESFNDYYVRTPCGTRDPAFHVEAMSMYVGSAMLKDLTRMRYENSMFNIIRPVNMGSVPRSPLEHFV